jgi:hypothetical protein
MGLNMKEKQAAAGKYRPRYEKAAKKEKRALFDEFTRLTGYYRKSAVRLLSHKPIMKPIVYANGEAVNSSRKKKRPANRRGKRNNRGLHCKPIANAVHLRASLGQR